MDKTLKLLIELGYIGADKAEAAKADLAAAKKGSAEMAEGLKIETKAAEEAGIPSRELGHILRDIGNVAAPGAGRALSELRFGPIGAALALFGVYEMLKKKIEDVDKAAEDLDKEQMESHRAAVEAVWRAWDDAKLKIEAYYRAVDQASREADPMAAALKQIQDLDAAENAAHLKRIERLNKERIAYMEAHPELFSARAVREVQERQTREEQAAAAAGPAQAAGNIEQDIAARKQEQSSLDAATKAAAEKLAQAQAALDAANKLKADSTEDPAKKAAAEKKASELQEKIDRQNEAIAASPNAPSVGWHRERIAELESKRDLILNQQKAETAAAEAAQKKIAAAEAAKAAAEDAFNAAKSRGEKNAGTITSETSQLGNMRAMQLQKEHQQAVDNILETVVTSNGETLESLATATGKTNDQMKTFAAQIADGQRDLWQTVATIQEQLRQMQGYSPR